MHLCICIYKSIVCKQFNNKIQSYTKVLRRRLCVLIDVEINNN